MDTTTEKKAQKNEKRTDGRGTIKISVRNLVEFLLREGDIDNRHGQSVSPAAMAEGSRMHRKIQRRQGSDYHAEVPLRLVIPEEHYDLILEGRADGIRIVSRSGEKIGYERDFRSMEVTDDMDVTIDEIKGVYTKPEQLTEPVRVHKAQAMCYAYIYALQHGLSRIRVQMTYVNLDTEEIRYFSEEQTFEELCAWFSELIGAYRKWADFSYAWRILRQASIRKLSFPFPYREGQKELVTDVYRTILRKKNLFLQAPTGVGKTISTVFPAVKAVGEELGDRIFYLTAKTVTGTVARETFELLRKGGYQAKVIQITAKEKICLCETMECDPVHCPYAKGHYDRVNDAVFSLLQREDVFTRELIREQAKACMVCPFELSLDLASWADDIICDYNYVFDPNVYLKRFFAEGTKGDYLFLVDEAHNLVERSREMYSAALCKEDFLAVKKIVKRYKPSLAAGFDKCNRILLDYKRECETYRTYDDIGNLLFHLMRLASDLDEFLQRGPDFPERRTVSEFYFQLRNFINIYERVDEHYVIYAEHTDDGRFRMKLYCVDPSKNLQECIDRGNAAIFFSATFLPIRYYKSLLSTRQDNYAVYAKTAFSGEQSLLLTGADVSSRYTRRNAEEFEKIARYIAKVGRAKTGNYMVFFPSYKMLTQVLAAFSDINAGEADVLVQTPGMREAEREAFLGQFEEKRDRSLVAFCVMGGIFGEGIDLKNERLIGAIVVGTGLPQIGYERQILQDYYEKKTGEGFDYAYRYPGMNKVLQAAGRVIRTTRDVGVILLLDERFLRSDYKALFPKEWESRRVCTLESVDGMLAEFWKN